MTHPTPTNGGGERQEATSGRHKDTDMRWNSGKGCGFINSDGSLAMTRCAKCGTENYAGAVLDGVCFACGYDANEHKAALARGTGGEG